MRKIKHSKFKNTGVLFELLVRQVTADTLNNTESKALPIIKEYFGKNTTLKKELQMYQALLKERFNSENKCDRFVDAILTSRGKLSNSILNRQKYNLIKAIKENFVIEDFFKARISNYKEQASIYKLFEYNMDEAPAEMINSRATLVEHISRIPNPEKATSTNLIQELQAKDKTLSLLAWKLLVDKFNKKYANNLSVAQKGLLREYIENVSTSDKLKQYVDDEVIKLQTNLLILNKTVKEKVVQIKINEAVKLLGKLPNKKFVEEKQILLLMRYHELLKELKKTEKK